VIFTTNHLVGAIVSGRPTPPIWKPGNYERFARAFGRSGPFCLSKSRRICKLQILLGRREADPASGRH
jgi:hypothetical protein